MPVPWVQKYQLENGAGGRIFTTTRRASEDLLSNGFRRMPVNACLWAVGLKEEIKKNNNFDFVGEYSPKLLTLKAINQR